MERGDAFVELTFYSPFLLIARHKHVTLSPHTPHGMRAEQTDDSIRTLFVPSVSLTSKQARN